MQAKPGVIELLNQHLTIELTAVNQYFLAAKQCDNWGFQRLHDRFRYRRVGDAWQCERLAP